MCDGADCYIIGGGEIYRQAFPIADRLELTLIDAECPDADTHFPDVSAYTSESQDFDRTDSRSGVRYCFLTIDLR